MLPTTASAQAHLASGKIRALYGFGARRERQLLQGSMDVLAGRPKMYAPVPDPEEDELPEPTPITRRFEGHDQLSLPAAA